MGFSVASLTRELTRGLTRPAGRQVAEPSDGSTAASNRLANDQVVVILDDSYGQKNLSNDTTLWTRAFAGCRGYAPTCYRHARSGDTLKDYRARIPQVLAMRPKAVLVGNAQNSTAQGLAGMQADYLGIYNDLIAGGVTRIVFCTQCVTISANEAAVAPLNTWLNGTVSTWTGVEIADDHGAADLSDAALNDTTAHPNARGSIKLGAVRGAALARCFAAAAISTNFAVALPDNLNPDFAMPDSNVDGISDGFALTNNFTGCTVTTAMGNFRSPGMTGVPCQILRVSGTSAVDPAGANDLKMTKTLTFPTGTLMSGRAYTLRLFVEISNASADWASATGPVNLATFALQGANTAFCSRFYAPTTGAAIFDAPFANFVQPMSLIQTVQSLSYSAIIHARPMANVAADYEIRFGYLNVVEEEKTAYGVPYDQSIILFDTNNAAVFSNATPAFTGTAQQGLNLTFSRPGIVSGGGWVAPAVQYGGGTNYPLNAFMARSPYALPGDVAGNIEGARPNGVAAVPYTVQVGDVGQKLKMGVQWENSFGSLVTYSAESATVT